MPDKKKDKLVDFLDEKIFKPILSKNPDDVKSRDRDKLKDVQESTEAERRRFKDKYQSAERVKDMYHDDLTSRTAKRIQKESKELGLPTLPDVEEEFDELCEKLGV